MIDIDQSGAVEVRNARAEGLGLFLGFWITFGWPLFAWPIVALVHHLVVWVAVAYLVVLTGLLATGCYRSSRIALLIGDDGLMVRNFLWSWRVSWSQVAGLTDGYAGSEGSWQLTVLLADGHAVTATATASACGVLGDPRTLSVLREVAAAHGIADDMTGIAAWRRRAWQDAVTSARWYKIWLWVWLLATVGGFAGLVALIAWNEGQPNYGPVFLPLGYAVVAAAVMAVMAGKGLSRALQPEPGRRAGFGEGDWFAVPMGRDRYAVGVIARRQQRGRGAIVGYFFAPFESPQPAIDTIRELHQSGALLVGLFPASCIRPPGPGFSGSWPLLGRVEPWDRDEWPVPLFTRTDLKAKQSFKVRCDDQLGSVREEPDPADPDDIAGLPAWQLLSEEAVVAALKRRLAAASAANARDRSSKRKRHVSK
jgi:hypothetical protein